MEPARAAATFLALVETNLSTFRTIETLIRSYCNAPSELHSLKHDLDNLSSQLILLKQIEIYVSFATLQITEEDFSHIERFLTNTTQTYLVIRDCLAQQIVRNGKSDRIKWALFNSRKVEGWRQEIRSYGLDLAHIMVLLNIRLSNIMQSDFHHLRKLLENKYPPLSVEMKSSRHFRWATILKSFWLLPPFIKFAGEISSTMEDQNSIYRLSMRFQALFCLKALSLELKILHPSLFTVQISSLDSRMRLRNLIPDDSELMIACSQGNTTRVWNLLHSKKASVNDITENNYTPLMFAIESGSLKLVSVLINAGASVKESFGNFQTTPLDWSMAQRKPAITRLLLEKGADVNNINGRGWTPLFNLFDEEKLQNGFAESAEEYAEMFVAQSFSEFHVQDRQGWTCVHRAAAFGTAMDIKVFSRFHAPFTLQTVKLSWPPIFCAVQFGNVATFLELRRMHSNFLQITDVRMWTLLHVAVNIKSIELIRLLIDLGADPHARSMPTDYLVPEDLENIAVTPGDIALIRGPDVRLAYLEALKTNGHTAELWFDDSNGEEDLFWAAMDGLT